MGQDAVALVRVPDLRVRRGSGLSVTRLKDGALVFTGERLAGSTADEHVARLRKQLGTQLDAHDDARGVLIFSDYCEVSAKTYAGAVAEIGRAGKWGLASRVTSKRAPRVDRLLRDSAAERGLDHEWFVRRSRKRANGEEGAELEDLVLDVVNTLVDDSGGNADEEVARELVEARVAALVADPAFLSRIAPKKRKAAPLTKPTDPGYDPDVAEMIRLFGGDEKSWSGVLDTRPTDTSVGVATRPKTKRRG